MRTLTTAQAEHEARVTAALKEILGSQKQPACMSDVQALVKLKVGRGGAYETLIRCMRTFDFWDKEWWMDQYGHVDTPAHRQKIRKRRKAQRLRQAEKRRAEAEAATVHAPKTFAQWPAPENAIPLSADGMETRAETRAEAPEAPARAPEALDRAPETPESAASVVATPEPWEVLLHEAHLRGSKRATVSFEAKEVTVVMGYA